MTGFCMLLIAILKPLILGRINPVDADLSFNLIQITAR